MRLRLILSTCFVILAALAAEASAADCPCQNRACPIRSETPARPVVAAAEKAIDRAASTVRTIGKRQPVRALVRRLAAR